MVYYDNSTNITNITNVVNVKNNEEDSEKLYRIITVSFIISATVGILMFHVYNVYKKSILVFPIDELPQNIPSTNRTTTRYFRDDYTDDDYFNPPQDHG